MRTVLKWLGSIFVGGALAIASSQVAEAFVITRTSSSSLYGNLKASPQINGNYVAYQIKNDSSTNYPDVWVKIDSFTGGATLAQNEDGLVHLGSLAAGETKTAFFYLQIGASTTTAQSHTVRIFPTRPPSAELFNQSFSITSVDTGLIEARANKVLSTVSGPNPPILGGLVTITVTGETGTVGGANILSFNPATYLTWDAKAYELLNTKVTLTLSNGSQSYNNQLLIIAPETSNTPYSATYTFRAATSATAPVAISPVSFINSGSPLKHTATSDFNSLVTQIRETRNVLTLSKIASTNRLFTAGRVTYTLRLTNTGSVDVSADDFVDTLPTTPGNSIYVSGSSKFNGVAIADPIPSGSNRTWVNTFTVPAGTSRDLTYQVDLPATNGTYTNTAVAHIGTTQIDQTLDTSDNAPATASVLVQPNSANLSVTKTDSPDPALVGSNLTYTVTVTNNGPDAATGVTLTDNLPAGVTFVSATPTQGTCSQSNGTVTCNVGNLANGATAQAQIVVKPTTTGTISNTASVTGNETDTNTANNSATQGTTVNPAADLSLTKTHTGNFTVGQNGNYTLTVSNNGPSLAGAITVTDTLPTGLTFVSGTGTGWTCSASGQTVTCTNSNPLASGNNSTINLTVAVGAAAATVTNTATVSSTTTDPTPGNNTASDPTTVVPTADIALSKTHSGDFTVGQNGTYTLNITNNGLSTAAGPLTVTDTLPTGLSFVSGTGSGWSCSASGQTVTCTNPNPLASGATSTVTLTVAVGPQAAPSVTNTASASSATSDPTPSNNTVSDLTTVRPTADLSLTKTTNNPKPNFGDVITYTVTLTNSGPSTATKVQVTDNVPTGLISVFPIPSSGTTYNSSTGVWSVSSLASGASVTLQIRGVVDTTGAITNTAEVTASDQFDSDSTPNNHVASEDDQASVTTPVQAADLSITKTDGKTTTTSGSAITYTITVTNNGPSDVTSATVSDTVPNTITGVSWTCVTSAGSSCGTASGTGNAINTTINLLNAGTATYTVKGTLDPTATGNIQNTASVVVPVSVTDTDNTNNSATDTTNVVSDPSRLRLVKRITAINSVNITGFIDNPSDSNDDNTVNWTTPRTDSLRGAIDGGLVKPGDVVEYTIYFLSDGGNAATNVRVCDLVPANTTFIPNAFNGSAPTDGGLSGADEGIALALGSTTPTAYLTNVADAPDRGQFFSPGTSAPAACNLPSFTSPVPGSSNVSGAVVVDVVKSPTTLPAATAPGTPANSYGFVRFWVRVN